MKENKKNISNEEFFLIQKYGLGLGAIISSMSTGDWMVVCDYCIANSNIIILESFDKKMKYNPLTNNRNSLYLILELVKEGTWKVIAPVYPKSKKELKNVL